MMLRQRRAWLAAGGALVLTVGLAACGSSNPAPNPGPDAGPVVNLSDAEWSDLEKAAMDEGEVNLYWSMGEASVYSDLVDGFEEKYPDIKLNISFLATGDLIGKLSEEIEAGVQSADVAVHASPAWFEQYDDAGSFASIQLSPENEGNGWSEWLGDNRFTPWWGFQVVLGHNTSKAAPDSLMDVVDSNPDAKIGLVDPGVAVPTGFIYEQLRLAYGDEILDKLAASRYTIYPSNSAMAAGMAAGEVDYGYPDLVSVTGALIEQGAPLAQVVTTEGQAGATYDVAALALAPHPAAAQVFMNYLMSEAGQKAIVADAAPAASVPLDVPDGIPWGAIATLDPDEWTTEVWEDWIAEYWTPRFG